MPADFFIVGQTKTLTLSNQGTSVHLHLNFEEDNLQMPILISDKNAITRLRTSLSIVKNCEFFVSCQGTIRTNAEKVQEFVCEQMDIAVVKKSNNETADVH